MANNSIPADLPPLPAYTITPLPSLVPGIPDQYLALVLPVVAYWAVSLFFHCLDVLDLFPQYRLHTPAEVLKRNHATRWDVFRDVIIQQVVQTVVGIGLTYFEDAPTSGREEYDVAVWATRIRTAERVLPGLLAVVGVDAAGLAKGLATDHSALAGALSGGIYPGLTQTVFMANGEHVVAPAFASWELQAARAVYHLLIPAVQFLLAVCVVDTWQYFLHRAMHMNKYLYVTFHSRHHRLYVPYAYGALYNHPLEGFCLDTVGTCIAYLVTGMTCRQSMWFFTCATIKTVDDHCGYAFPWDPLQHITSNNAGYHDVHHQSWGIKANFSQPFFTFWDRLLGTKWTGGDVSARYERARLAAQKKVDADKSVAPITGSGDSSESTQGTAPYEAEVDNASPAALAANVTMQPRVPSGKAAPQALGSRQQVLDDDSSQTGAGLSVLARESAEEARAQAQLNKQSISSFPSFSASNPTSAASTAPRRSPRKRAQSSGLKGLADRMGESLHGRGTGVLGVESGRR